ncbi:alpha/beta fold hydrolase [Cupriavidus sp. 2TAF22]|uniref:alpha/beta fold hydrolase n=1 Tax=unclassified Cupriavidus TaxID=2640874 RepID=UPI003F900047
MKLNINGVDLAYEVHGRSGPWVTFSHSLGCTRRMWERQIAALSANYRVLAYDLRGHGESGSDASPGSLALLGSDLLALLDHLGIASSHLIGISVGGMIGQTLAIEVPDRVASLVLANTTAYMPPLAVEMWGERIQLAEDRGVGALALPSMERWFPQAFREANPDVITRLAKDFAATSLQGYITCGQAIMGLDTREALAKIQCPTLIVGGTEDPGAPVEALHQMHNQIRGSELLILEGAGHLSNLDKPMEFTAEVTRHLLYCA